MTRRAAFAAVTGGIAPFAVVTAPTRAAEFSYKYAHNQPVDSPLHVRMTQLWDAVRRETQGRLSVQVFPNSAFGTDLAALEQVRLGALQILTLGGVSISGLVPAAGLESIPFAFKTYSQAYRAIDGSLGRYIRSEIETKGLHSLERPFEVGFYQITNSVRPIHTVEDLAGLKIRTTAAKLALDTFKSLGASALPLSVNESYTAMQTHLVDGQYNPYQLIEVNKWYEVQKYVTEVNLSWSSLWVMVNRDAWRALPPDVQDVVDRNEAKYALFQRRDAELLSAASVDKLIRQGMIRNVADPASFRAKLAEGFYQRWRDELGARGWAVLREHAGNLD